MLIIPTDRRIHMQDHKFYFYPFNIFSKKNFCFRLSQTINHSELANFIFDTCYLLNLYLVVLF